MGSGVAKAIRARFPGCFETYAATLAMIKERGGEVMGLDASFYDAATDKTIHNLVTQADYGKDGKKYARYLHVIDALDTMLTRDRSFRELAIPQIGCGLGGLSWSILTPILEELEEKHRVEFVVYILDVVA